MTIRMEQIDIAAASTAGWIDRSELARQISSWELSGMYEKIL